jgi:hypothetical protein
MHIVAHRRQFSMSAAKQKTKNVSMAYSNGEFPRRIDLPPFPQVGSPCQGGRAQTFPMDSLLSPAEKSFDALLVVNYSLQ